jgi:DNA-binding NtrC family response regulator
MLQNAAGVDFRTVRRVCIPLTQDGDDQRVKKTVLLVTADPNLREAAARALEAAGYTAVPAAHSGHATLAARAGGRIDILATDLEMDDLPGPALAARLRRDHPALQTLFFADTEGISPAEADRLLRPFTRQQFLDAITALA